MSLLIIMFYIFWRLLKIGVLGFWGSGGQPLSRSQQLHAGADLGLRPLGAEQHLHATGRASGYRLLPLLGLTPGRLQLSAGPSFHRLLRRPPVQPSGRRRRDHLRSHGQRHAAQQILCRLAQRKPPARQPALEPHRQPHARRQSDLATGPMDDTCQFIGTAFPAQPAN